MQFEQLPLFMSASDITKRFAGLDEDRKTLRTPEGLYSRKKESDDQLMARKRYEAKKTGVDGSWLAHSNPSESLYNNIAREGVQTPVDIALDQNSRRMRSKKGVIANGHHRVAVGVEVAPDRLIPVQFHRKAEETW